MGHVNSGWLKTFPLPKREVPTTKDARSKPLERLGCRGQTAYNGEYPRTNQSLRRIRILLQHMRMWHSATENKIKIDPRAYAFTISSYFERRALVTSKEG